MKRPKLKHYKPRKDDTLYCLKARKRLIRHFDEMNALIKRNNTPIKIKCLACGRVVTLKYADYMLLKPIRCHKIMEIQGEIPKTPPLPEYNISESLKETIRKTTEESRRKAKREIKSRIISDSLHPKV